MLPVLTESDSQPLTFASSRGSIKMRMSASSARMDRPFTAGQLNPSLFSIEDLFMWKKSLLRLYLQRGELFAPMECIFTTGHRVNLLILLSEAFFHRIRLQSVMRKKMTETLKCPSRMPATEEELVLPR